MIAQKFFLANKINSTEFLMQHREYVINAYISTYLPVPATEKMFGRIVKISTTIAELC